ncbi:MAG TPA: alpha/beta hydrolase [Candidatus Saccharimonadales bacterium]|jgi:hypothetical protein
MRPRIVYLHGNQTTHWSFAWSKWLKEELEKNGHETFFETLPDSVLARKEYWLPFMKDHIKVGGNDVVVGWSSGAVAAMRFAETNKIKGSVLISPCYTDLDDEMEKQSGYYADAWKWDQIKSNQDKIALFSGDDDPYINQSEFSFIAEQVSAEHFSVPGGEHFIGRSEFPELLSYIQSNY